MQPSNLYSRFSIFDFRNLCEIAGLTPDGSPRDSGRHPSMPSRSNSHSKSLRTDGLVAEANFEE